MYRPQMKGFYTVQTFHPHGIEVQQARTWSAGMKPLSDRHVTQLWRFIA